MFTCMKNKKLCGCSENRDTNKYHCTGMLEHTWFFVDSHCSCYDVGTKQENANACVLKFIRNTVTHTQTHTQSKVYTYLSDKIYTAVRSYRHCQCVKTATHWPRWWYACVFCMRCMHVWVSAKKIQTKTTLWFCLYSKQQWTQVCLIIT